MTKPNPNSVFPAHKDKYYVYMLCRPDNSIFYVGKGKGVRINNHFNASNLTSNSIKNNIINKYGVENIKREIISYHDTEEEAFNVEEFLIASYGVMAEGGLLTNVAKTRWDYPDTVKGFIASGEPRSQQLYKDEIIVQAYEMWFRDCRTRQDISETTGIPVNYLYYVLSGKKAKGVFETVYVQDLMMNSNRKNPPCKVWKCLDDHTFNNVVAACEDYTLTRKDISLRYNLTDHCLRRLIFDNNINFKLASTKTKVYQHKDTILDMYKTESMSYIARTLGLPKNSLIKLLKREGVYRNGNSSDTNSDNAS